MPFSLRSLEFVSEPVPFAAQIHRRPNIWYSIADVCGKDQSIRIEDYHQHKGYDIHLRFGPLV